MREKLESNTGNDTTIRAEAEKKPEPEYDVIYESSPYRTSEEEMELVKDYCEANDIEIPEEGSSEWYDILNNLAEFDSEWFWDQVKQFDKKHSGKILINGTLGLWWGHPDIDPQEADDLESAIRRCISRSILDIRLYEDGKGYLFLDCMHHDGTNFFKLTGPKGGGLKFGGVVFGKKYRRKRKEKVA